MDIVELSLEHEAAFLAMIEDYQRKDPVALKTLYPTKDKWTSESFKKYIKSLEKLRQDWRPKAGRVSVTRYVLLDQTGQTILASGLMRFPLDVITEIDGGNLTFDVPPSFRGRGVGSFCLSRLLFEAVRAGLRRALVTCPESDGAARRIIEKNRGELQDIVLSSSPEREGTKISRYWIRFS